MTEIKISRFVLSWQKRTTKEVLTLKLGTETKVKRLENCKNLLWKACKIRVIRIHLIGLREIHILSIQLWVFLEIASGLLFSLLGEKV